MNLAYKGECVAQIKFPKSSDNFSGSGKTHNFVAYFEGHMKFPTPGTWVMYTTSWDGSKLYMEGELIVNNNGLHNVLVEKNGTIDIGDEESLVKHFRLEYFKGEKGENGLILKWKGPGSEKKEVRPADFHVPASFTITGLPSHAPLWYQAYTTRYTTPSRNMLPTSFDIILPVSNDTSYFYQWPKTACNLTDNYAVVLEGYVVFPRPGRYILSEKSDDDARMFVDGQLVRTVRGNVGVRDKGRVSITIAQKEILHHLRVEFLELCLGNGLELTWEGPQIARGTPLRLCRSEEHCHFPY